MGKFLNVPKKESSELVKKFGTKLILKCWIPSEHALLLINDYLHNGNHLVEYLTRKTYDLTEQLTEEIDVSNSRPYMSDIDYICQLVTRKRVDVWYNYGWW